MRQTYEARQALRALPKHITARPWMGSRVHTLLPQVRANRVPGYASWPPPGASRSWKPNQL